MSLIYNKQYFENTTEGLKIGILTFHRCINYGSYWQTHCLAGLLQARGHRVEVLDHRSVRVNLAEWKCALQPVLPTPVPPSDHPLYRQKIKKFFDAFEALPLSAPFPLEDPSQTDGYDLIVVGSDEVWNLSHPWYGHYPVFYGEGLKTGRLISYASSFGNYDESWLSDPDLVRKLRRFEKISVRDENSRIIIRNTLGFDPAIIPDPCLQFPEAIPLQSRPATVNRSYALVYGHNFSVFFKETVRKMAREQKLRLISIGYRNDWADEQLLIAGPHEFALFMQQAEAVVTNFFHGCVFALINAKPFVCEPTDYRSNKILDLLQRTGGEHHILEEGNTAYRALLATPPDQNIFRKLHQMRSAASCWLDLTLGSP